MKLATRGVVSSGSGGGDIEARLATLETTVQHMQSTIGDIKTDVRELRNWGLGAVAFLIVGMAGAYLALSSGTNAVDRQVSDVKNSVERISDSVNATRALVQQTALSLQRVDIPAATPTASDNASNIPVGIDGAAQEGKRQSEGSPNTP